MKAYNHNCIVWFFLVSVCPVQLQGRKGRAMSGQDPEVWIGVNRLGREKCILSEYDQRYSQRSKSVTK
jgi:hypothetical protein